ncbi:MAG: antibiotic biosynthesis monooxygenase [Rhizobiaceae bacterium]|nr:antibiotic biosynthesis monooxygenase [Rhizobiaceae bacterium]
MPEVAVIVEFETLEGAEPEFLRVIQDHARRTLDEEDGCLRYEIYKPIDSDGSPIPNCVLVDELYADQAAVEAHTLNPRMSAFNLIIDPLLKSHRRIVARSLSEREPEEGIPPSELNAANDD